MLHISYIVFLKEVREKNVFLIVAYLKIIFQHIYWKKSAYKWTSTVQICVDQGSTVYSTLPSDSFYS